MDTDMSTTSFGVVYDPNEERQNLRLTLKLDDDDFGSSVGSDSGLEVHLNNKIFGIKFDELVADYYIIEDCAYGQT